MHGVGDYNLEQRLQKCTEKVTHCIHDLWQSIQITDKQECCVPSADKIRIAVAELTSIVPQVSIYLLNK